MILSLNVCAIQNTSANFANVHIAGSALFSASVSSSSSFVNDSTGSSIASLANTSSCSSVCASTYSSNRLASSNPLIYLAM